MDRREIEISTTHRLARKTGSSELWRNLGMSKLGVLPAAAIIEYWPNVTRLYYTM